MAGSLTAGPGSTRVGARRDVRHAAPPPHSPLFGRTLAQRPARGLGQIAPEPVQGVQASGSATAR